MTCEETDCDLPACTLVRARWRCLKHTKQALEAALIAADELHYIYRSNPYVQTEIEKAFPHTEGLRYNQ